MTYKLTIILLTAGYAATVQLQSTSQVLRWCVLFAGDLNNFDSLLSRGSYVTSCSCPDWRAPGSHAPLHSSLVRVVYGTVQHKSIANQPSRPIKGIPHKKKHQQATSILLSLQCWYFQIRNFIVLYFSSCYYYNHSMMWKQYFCRVFTRKLLSNLKGSRTLIIKHAINLGQCILMALV